MERFERSRGAVQETPVGNLIMIAVMFLSGTTASAQPGTRHQAIMALRAVQSA
jgi:hypothetical protein